MPFKNKNDKTDTTTKKSELLTRSSSDFNYKEVLSKNTVESETKAMIKSIKKQLLLSQSCVRPMNQSNPTLE